MIDVRDYAASRGIRFYQTMPPLAADEFEALKQSIIAEGITVPVIVDEHGNVIDGHHRVQIARELGIDYPTRKVEGLSEQEKLTMSVSLNINRRQLTREQRRLIIAEQLKAAPEKSNVQHAKALGVSDNTVRAVRQELESTSQIARLETTVGADGRERPARRPEPEVVADPRTGEVTETKENSTVTATESCYTLRTDAEWQEIAKLAKNYRFLDDAHAALSPKSARDHFSRKMREHGIAFTDKRIRPQLETQANGVIERISSNILGTANDGIEALDVIAVDLIDAETAAEALEQLEAAIPVIRKLIKTLKGI